MNRTNRTSDFRRSGVKAVPDQPGTRTRGCSKNGGEDVATPPRPLFQIRSIKPATLTKKPSNKIQGHRQFPYIVVQQSLRRSC